MHRSIRHCQQSRSMTGMKWNFIYSRILGQILLLTKNGDMVMNRKISLTQHNWIASNGAVSQKQPEQKALLSQQNIMMVFVYGPANIQLILFVKANGRRVREMF